jgi:hypothetical protein
MAHGPNDDPHSLKAMSESSPHNQGKRISEEGNIKKVERKKSCSLAFTFPIFSFWDIPPPTPYIRGGLHYGP